jgi:hypothetical protein
MKKIISNSFALATILLFSGCSEAIMQQDVKTPIQIPQSDKHIFNYDKIKDESVKGLLYGLEASFPGGGQVMRDYLAAQSCDDEFYTKKTKDELSTKIKELGASVQYGTLIGYYYGFDDHKACNNIINNYKHMNCGTEKYTPDIMKDETMSGSIQPKNSVKNNSLFFPTIKLEKGCEIIKDSLAGLITTYNGEETYTERITEIKCNRTKDKSYEK